jgi:hypothetical protein
MLNLIILLTMNEKAVRIVFIILIISILTPFALFLLNSIVIMFQINNAYIAALLILSGVPCGIISVISAVILLGSGKKTGKLTYSAIAVAGIIIGIIEILAGGMILSFFNNGPFL